MRRIICCAMALVLLLLCGCTGSAEQDAPTLSFYINLSTTDADALTAISKALDDYVYQKLGFHVQLHTPSDYNQTLADDLRQGKQIDAAMVYTSVAQLGKEGLLRPLDSLLQTHGDGISSVINEAYFQDALVDGVLYTFPTNRDRHTAYGFAYNREVAERYGLDLSDVDSLDDLTAVFGALAEQTSDVTPSVIYHRITRYGVMDGLSDYYGGVLMLDDGTTVVNLFETPQFEKIVRLIYQWNQAGYLLDQTEEGGSAAYYLGSGQILGCLTEGHVLYSAQESKFSETDIGFIPLAPAYYNSDNTSLLGYAIPTSANYPELAMDLLNLLYTDTYAANLLMYGIEDVHFVRSKEDPSVLCYPDSTGPEHYTGMYPWQYCNQYIADRWEGYAPDIWEQVEAANLSAIRSPAAGFRFDNTPVARQYQSVSEVVDKYLTILRAGLVDPDELLPEFRQALHAAGIDDIIAEKQRQLDLYVLQTP